MIDSYLDPVRRAREAKSARLARRALKQAQYRVSDALAMGAAGLAASWQRDVAAIEGLMRSKGWLEPAI